MDILQEKQRGEYDYELMKIIKNLQYKNFKIEFKGSASLKSQRFFSDYDLFTNISENQTSEEAYITLKDIINNVSKMDNVYFMELKMEKKNGEKIKFYTVESIKYPKFKKAYENIDFVKIDYITFLNNVFMELSIIYQFGKGEMEKKEYLKSLKEDMQELKKENKYYKLLKRLFNVYKMEENREGIIFLNEVFNSDLGEIYQKISNLEAIISLSKVYKDKETKKRILINLKDIRETGTLPTIRRRIKKYNKILNEIAREIYEELI